MLLWRSEKNYLAFYLFDRFPNSSRQYAFILKKSFKKVSAQWFMGTELTPNWIPLNLKQTAQLSTSFFATRRHQTKENEVKSTWVETIIYLLLYLFFSPCHQPPKIFGEWLYTMCFLSLGRKIKQTISEANLRKSTLYNDKRSGYAKLKWNDRIAKDCLHRNESPLWAKSYVARALTKEVF